jgi:hypothetical protein
MADGKYAARKLQFTIIKSGGSTLNGVEAFGLVYKWKDGLNGQPIDSFIQALELELVGLSRKLFTNADTSGDPVTVNIIDPVTPSKTVYLDSNMWYWTPAQATIDATNTDLFIGVDESVSNFTRSYEQSQVFNFQEHPMILFTRDYTELSIATGAVATFPFAGHGLLADSSFYDRFYYVPSVALHIGKTKLGTPGVGVEQVAPEVGTVKVYPVPANNYLNVDVQLNKQYSVVNYRLLDLAGRVVYKLDKPNVQSEKFTIPTETLPAGVYHLFLGSGEDVLTTRKVVITH